MFKHAILCAGALCLVISCADVKKVHHFTPLPSAIPVLSILNDTTASALKMSSLDIDVVVAANIGTTTFDIRFYNPNDKILEGEFEFPLADGQHITRYALDMNGSLREGVVVEKAKARIAFENTIRQKIDPGLVEKTKGNNFRTRIYPLPAKGYRRIVIAVEQTLELQQKDILYQLPLYATEPIDTFSFKATVIKSSSIPQLDEKGIPGLYFKKENTRYVARHKAHHFMAAQTIAFAIPGSQTNSDIVLTENHDDQTYFYVNSGIEPQFKEKKKPVTVGLFWDISGSADKRDIKKETELLKQYLDQLGNVTISLIPFNVFMQEKQEFAITGNNSDELFKRIRELQYDGGTQLGILDPGKYNFDEVLLFSDGMSTFGKQYMEPGKSPVTCITTSPSANYSYLKYIARESRGAFIDLGKLEIKDALKELQGQSLQVVKISYNNAAIKDLALQTTPVSNSGFSFAGKLNASSADIKVELGFGNEAVITKHFTISKKSGDDHDQVKRIWATMKINELDMEYEKNKEAITTLGKEFSVVTQNTSLLVLDRVEDYVEHEITPPAELMKEYLVVLKEKRASEKNKTEEAFNEAMEAMNSLKAWWNTDQSRKQQTIAGREVSTDSAVYFNLSESQNSLGEVSISADSLAYHQSAPAGSDRRISNAAPLLEVTAGSGAFNLTYAMPDQDGIADRIDLERKDESVIALNEWRPDAPYLKTLEQVSSNERMNKYLELKKQYSTQPSFFADVARFFMGKNEKILAIQVLSNIAELKLENAELLRIVANQLLEMNEKELAVETFDQILKMREEEPQAYRDLALACTEINQYNRAVELLYKLVLGSWDGRFGDVKAIALNEMNAIISAHTGSVNTSAIDPRFIYAMPVDVRIVIGWNTDNSDIDLWVTDPRKEKCYYQNRETGIGGKISQDVTRGYGPEEYSLKKAMNGEYTVEVNLYGDTRQTMGGPITIKGELFTDYGRPTQKRKLINFRVNEDKEVVKIGSLRL